MAGQTNAALAGTNASASMAGTYSVKVSNGFGSLASSNATITVLPMPTLAEAVNAPQLVWTTGGNANWFVQGASSHDSVAAAQSGKINDNQSTWLETKITGPGTLSFWWQVDSQSGFDMVKFLVDGTQEAWRAGAEPLAGVCLYGIFRAAHPALDVQQGQLSERGTGLCQAGPGAVCAGVPLRRQG